MAFTNIVIILSTSLLGVSESWFHYDKDILVKYSSKTSYGKPYVDLSLKLHIKIVEKPTVVKLNSEV